MSTPLIGILISALSALILVLVFRAEQRRGSRFLAYPRQQFDSVILQLESTASHSSKFVGGDMFRQLVHYFFHTFLSRLARFLMFMERKVESLLRSNRLLAKRARQDRTTRNMLDEIAEHRAATAFTDEERKQHRDDALNKW